MHKKISIYLSVTVLVAIAAVEIAIGGALAIVTLRDNNYFSGFWEILLKIFYPKDEINTGLLTVIAAVLGVFITTRSNYKGIKSNIISKERGKWLDHHKENMAEFLKISRQVEILSNRYFNICLKSMNEVDDEKSKALKKSEEVVREINDKQQEMIFLKNILSLGLSEDNNENKNFLNKIEQIIGSTDQYRKFSADFVREHCCEITEKIDKSRLNEILTKFKEHSEIKKYKNSIDELITASKIYYKEVWINIKKGK